MSTPSEWSLTAPQNLTFDEPVTALDVRLVNGTVNVVGTDAGPARLELSAVSGPPLVVTLKGGTLTVGYEDLPWKGFLNWLDGKGWQRSATVTLAVPADTRVKVGVVGASAVVSGVSGATDVRGVTGDTTLVGLTGPVRAESVSGGLEAQSLTGTLRFNSVSGDLTLVENRSGTVKAESVNGSMVIDRAEPDGAGTGTDSRTFTLDLTTVSGDVALRLPRPVDAVVEAATATGAVSCAFHELRVGGQWAGKHINGELGTPDGSRIKVTSVSGAVALLHRPPAADGSDAPAQGKAL
ncbi:DUF4097 family beta strand repeat-containing protein [Streptomyces sp. I05A-00742]|uniref:DUF4097 family beta strand repeat-containing protein n=1 Tax=Streptomyces sp. I05A-00742 TaxID=2732853 RepID=UPI0014887675|nr:DUF4097 family beta strand repeat-containing protein [Streptomyces sp. I05A-00742]